MAREVLDEVSRPATLCAFCPKMCRFACPVAEAEDRETVTPWAKMSTAYLAREGDVRLEDADVQNALEACTGCGACANSCAHGNPVAETLFALRGGAKTDRSVAYREAFEKTGDVKGRNLDEKLRALPSMAKAPVAYFPGCTRLCGDAAGIDKDRRALAQALGTAVPVVELPEKHACCGYPLFADGQLDLLERHLDEMGKALSAYELVVTPDPGCAYTLSVVADGLLDGRQARPDVVPLVEVLARYADRFEGAQPGLKVRYHDPCYLGRRGRTYEAPRRLLQAATQRVPGEFAQQRESADCAGGGGLYPVSNPEAARTMAKERVDKDPIPLSAGEVVATACPSAAKNFARAGVAVVDVVDVCLGEARVPKPTGGRLPRRDPRAEGGHG